MKAAEIKQAENQSTAAENNKVENQSKDEQTGSIDDVQPSTSGIKSGKSSIRGKGKQSNEEVTMDTE